MCGGLYESKKKMKKNEKGYMEVKKIVKQRKKCNILA
jgi:hypothetical protein